MARYGLSIMAATGRAHCKLCGSQIEKGDIALKYTSGSSGPNFQIHYDHSRCEDNQDVLMERREAEREIGYDIYNR